MRGGLISGAATVLALLVAVPLSGAASNPARFPSMTVRASPDAAHAQRVRVTVTLRYVMQCGYPGAGPLVVTFPSAVRLPKRFATGAVKLSGKAAAATIRARRVTVTVPPHNGVLCSTMGPGPVSVVFTRTARLADPMRAGSYRFTATHAKHTFKAKLVVKPGT